MSRPRNNQRPAPRDRLFQKMSEVISLRERVALAELAVRVLNLPLDEREQMAEPPQKLRSNKHIIRLQRDCRLAVFCLRFQN
jgi:hypothetical protein